MANDSIHITTTEHLPGYRVTEYKGVVWASSARAKSVLSDIATAFTLMVGGEIKIYTRLTNEARSEVLKRLSENAKKMGANAVIGTKFGSTQVLPGTLDIFAYGTAVKAEKERTKG